ncbi:MAG: hypothetical protein IH933_15235 [Euryarchaeota archaeon]|nr:hypothetical protein [Euryarchaeota archaeon]
MAPRDGEPAELIERSVGLIAENEWEEAADLLTGAFEEPSICARERPNYTVSTEYGTQDHFAACHIHRDR